MEPRSRRPFHFRRTRPKTVSLGRGPPFSFLSPLLSRIRAARARPIHLHFRQQVQGQPPRETAQAEREERREEDYVLFVSRRLEPRARKRRKSPRSAALASDIWVMRVDRPIEPGSIEKRFSKSARAPRSRTNGFFCLFVAYHALRGTDHD